MVDLPDPQSLFVIEGVITDERKLQSVTISQTTGFSDPNPVIPIESAEVLVQSRAGETFLFTHHENGTYRSNIEFAGMAMQEYRVRVQLENGDEIRSKWEQMPDMVEILNLSSDSFQENDPDNNNQQITVYFPKVSAIDPTDTKNYYRWIFYRDGERYVEPESITIQDDRFFDGNFIPNNFQDFGYNLNDQIIVQLLSISKESFEYLSLLKSQITTLGTSSGTTPSVVNGNLEYISDEINEQVLGFFSTVAISADTTMAE